MSQELLDALKNAHANPIADEINKAYSQSASATSGLTAYDLTPGAKLLYPKMTPLRNRIARVANGVGTATNWRAVTGINTNGMGLGIGEGARGGIMGQTTKDFTAKYAFLGMENYTTFEAEYAGKSFEDVKALASKQLLESTMIEEEHLDYNGNASLALGITPTPTVAGSTTGGSIPAGTYNVIAVALTHFGLRQVKGSNNGATGQSLNIATANLVATYDKKDAGSGDITTIKAGTAQKSVATSVTTTGATSSITASLATVNGAEGYAWFVGTAGNEVLTAVSSVNSVSITALSASTVNASRFATDCSADSTVYDGILTQIFTPGSGSYVRALPTGVAGVGSTLTSDGAGGVQEIEDALSAFYDNYRLSPETMYVSASVGKLITKLVIGNGGAPLIRFNGDLNGSNSVQAGTSVGSYLNKTTGDLIKIIVHPNAAPGSILFYSDSIPYPLSGVGSVLVKKLRKDYYQMEWALRTRKHEFGVYFDGVLQNFFTPAFGIIYNIAA